MDAILFKSCVSALAAALFLSLAGCAATSGRESAPGSYTFWPQFPDEPRMQFLASYRYSSDVRPPRSGFDELIFGKEQRVLPINMPYGVAMWNGRIYICDIRNAALISLDLREQRVRVLGTSGMTRFASPTDVAVSHDGFKYVTDLRRGAIFVFDADDRHVDSFGHKEFRPVGIAVHEDELFVGDFESQQVIVLDRHSGREIRRIGARGDGDGQFVWPLGVSVDHRGNVYVSDSLRCRIQKFSRDGELLKAWGEPGDAIGNFVRPKLLSVDSDGIVYVVDAAFQNVQMFNEDAELLMFFGGSGAHPGSMLLPVGVTVHDGDLDLFADRIHPSFKAERLVLVTNQFGPHRVAVYALGHLREGNTARDIVASSYRIPTDADGKGGDAGAAVPEGEDPFGPPTRPAETETEEPARELPPAHLLKPTPGQRADGP